MILRALTRAANLCDFDGVCPSVADWQQRHAAEATAEWTRAIDAPREPRVACVNWGAATFTAPHRPATCEYFDGRDAWIALPVAPVYAALYALSVLDRVELPMRVLHEIHGALLPGGLLVATVALWDATGPDCAIGHELRRRIYDRGSWQKLLYHVRQIGLRPFGGVDLRYPGDTLGDHTLAAIVLTKERI